MSHETSSDIGANSPISAVTAFDVATADAGDNLSSLAKTMNDNDIGALLITGHNGDIAILTERDLVRSLAEDTDAWAVDCMTRDVIVADSETSIADAAETMLVAGVRHLVIRRSDGSLGIASMRDLVGPLLDEIG
jgi:CBS domain-containing protein